MVFFQFHVCVKIFTCKNTLRLFFDHMLMRFRGIKHFLKIPHLTIWPYIKKTFFLHLLAHLANNWFPILFKLSVVFLGSFSLSKWKCFYNSSNTEAKGDIFSARTTKPWMQPQLCNQTFILCTLFNVCLYFTYL